MLTFQFTSLFNQEYYNQGTKTTCFYDEAKTKPKIIYTSIIIIISLYIRYIEYFHFLIMF